MDVTAEGFTRTTTTVPPRIHPCNNISMGNVCYTTLQTEQMNHIITHHHHHLFNLFDKEVC